MTQTIAVTRDNETTHGAYRAAVPGGKRDAELTWVARGEARIANHTWVPPEARGKGIAMALVEALVADGEKEGFKIEPQCSYVAAAFRRHPEWAKLRADPSS